MSTQISADVLNGKWIHSHEEDSDAESVYRPSTYVFPPSRGRSAFELKKGGILVESGPGPVDRMVQNSGTWELQHGKTPLLRLQSDGKSSRTLEIVSADKDKLVVKKS